MSKLSQIALMQANYLDQEQKDSILREKTIKKILIIENQINLKRYTRLELEMFTNLELKDILLSLKEELLFYKNFLANNIDLNYSEMSR